MTCASRKYADITAENLDRVGKATQNRQNVTSNFLRHFK